MRRHDKEITDRAEIERIIDEASVVRVGMIDGGRPYVVPMNFAREGEEIWLHSASKGRKLDCLAADPHVCVEWDRFISIQAGLSACNGWSAHYESVIGLGTAEIVTDPAEKERGFRALMRKYSGRDDWVFETVQTTAVVRIRLDAVTGKCSPAKA